MIIHIVLLVITQHHNSLVKHKQVQMVQAFEGPNDYKTKALTVISRLMK